MYTHLKISSHIHESKGVKPRNCQQIVSIHGLSHMYCIVTAHSKRLHFHRRRIERLTAFHCYHRYLQLESAYGKVSMYFVDYLGSECGQCGLDQHELQRKLIKKLKI